MHCPLLIPYQQRIDRVVTPRGRATVPQTLNLFRLNAGLSHDVSPASDRFYRFVHDFQESLAKR